MGGVGDPNPVSHDPPDGLWKVGSSHKPLLTGSVGRFWVERLSTG